MQVLITLHSSNIYCYRGTLHCGGGPGRESRNQAGGGGLWYVRNAAKANRKPHTPVSNEINALSFSGAKGANQTETHTTDETDCERFSSSSRWAAKFKPNLSRPKLS